MQLSLVRDFAGQVATLGVLTVGELQLQTLELPWHPAPPPSLCGVRMTSCLPPGEYSLVLHNSLKHPRTWALINPDLGVYHQPFDVPTPQCSWARIACLIHIANYPQDLEGCIGVGLRRSNAWGPWMVEHSRDAFAALQAALPWTDGHTLTISYAQGVAP